MHVQATQCVCTLFFLICTLTIACFTQKQLECVCFFFFNHSISWQSFQINPGRALSFLSTASEYSIVWTAQTFRIQATTADRQAGCFQLYTITHNSSLNNLAHMSPCTCEHMSEVGWLDERVCAFVSLINIAKLPFLEVIPSGA